MTSHVKNRARIIVATLIAITALLFSGNSSLPSLALDARKSPAPFAGTVIEKWMGGGTERPGKPSNDGSPKRPPEPAQSERRDKGDGVKSSPPEPGQEAESQSESKTKGAGKPDLPGELKEEKSGGSKEPDAGRHKEEEAVGAILKEARALAGKGDYSEALEKYGLVLKKTGDKGDQKILAAALTGMARMAQQLERDEEALGYVRRSIKLHQELKNAHARSLDYMLMGRILMRQSKYAPALEALEEALKILPNSESTERPCLLEEIASCELRLSKHSEALGTYGRLLALLSKEGNGKEAARIHVLMGDIQVSRTDFRGAGANFRKAEAIYRKLGAKKELGEILFRLAYVEQTAGDLKTAQKATEEGRSLLSGEAGVEREALPLYVSGMSACSEGRIVEAVKDLSAALDKYRKLGDRVMAARVLLALGKVENDRSRTKSALEHAGEALKEFRSLSDQGGEAASLLLIAQVYLGQGYVQKALEYAQDSLSIAKKISDPDGRVSARTLLAEIRTSLGEVEAAWKLLKESVEETSASLNRRTRGRLHLAAARFRFAGEGFDRVTEAVELARRDFKEINDRRGMADCDNLMGRVYELRGDSRKSFELLQRALAEHRAMWDLHGEGSDLTALGVHYKNLGDHETALNYFNQALDLRRRIGDRRGEAASLANAGNLAKHRTQVPEALRNLEQALEIYRDLADKKGQADILTNLGNVYAADRSHSAALDKLNTALSIHREIHDVRGEATDLASIGRLYLMRGDIQNARTNLEDAARVNKKISNPRGEVAILAELAMLRRAEKNTPQALALLDKALKLARKIDDQRAVSSIHLKMATVLRDSGDYQKAHTLLNETLEMMRQQQNRPGELWALGELGMVQVKMEDYESAIPNLRRALELRSELGLPSSQARDLDFYLGEIYEGFKDFEQALDHYNRALAVAQTTGTNSMLGLIYHRIGNIYYQMDEYAKARDLFEDALRVHSETKNIPMQKSELIRLGDILSKLGDSEAALKYQQKALALTKESNDSRTETRILTRIGTLYQMLGRPRIALEHYRESREKRSQLGDRRGVNENLLQIALVMSILGNFDEAVSHLKSSFEIAHASEDRSMLWQAYFIMGRTLQGKNRLGEALESYRKAITILEAMEADIIEESDEDNFIFGGKTALFETTLNLLMGLARKDPKGAYDSQAFRIMEKLRSAEFENNLSRINVETFSDLPPDLLLKEKSLKLSLRNLNTRLADELSKVKPDQDQIKKLNEERRAKEQVFVKLKARLVEEYPAYAALRYPAPVSVNQFQKEIVDPDEAILAYMVTRSRTYIFAVDKNRFNTYSTDYSRDHLQRDVQDLMRPLRRADAQESWDPSIAYRLYSKLIKPVEHFLAAKKTVMIIPHGPLASLPFEMLVTSDTHSGKRFWSATDRPIYLLETYSFCYSPAASVLSFLRARKRDAEPGWSLVAFGDAIYEDTDKKLELEPNPGAEKLMAAFGDPAAGTRGKGLRALPWSRQEISEIAKIMQGPTQTYFGAQATETLFKKADLSRYAYIHLATHGVVLNCAGKLQQQPAIVFSLYGDQENDGFLQLGEIFGLKLNADLVVLSSCLSSGGEPSGNAHGLGSLARGFLFAGAQSVIMSLWEVNDERTAKLFIGMYGKLKDGSKADALRRAKMELLKDQRTSHPYYWAPFVLVGDWHVQHRPGFNKMEPSKMRFKGLSTWRKILTR